MRLCPDSVGIAGLLEVGSKDTVRAIYRQVFTELAVKRHYKNLAPRLHRLGGYDANVLPKATPRAR